LTLAKRLTSGPISVSSFITTVTLNRTGFRGGLLA
jgi:hypothetical protein